MAVRHANYSNLLAVMISFAGVGEASVFACVVDAIANSCIAFPPEVPCLLYGIVRPQLGARFRTRVLTTTLLRFSLLEQKTLKQ